MNDFWKETAENCLKDNRAWRREFSFQKLIESVIKKSFENYSKLFKEMKTCNTDEDLIHSLWRRRPKIFPKEMWSWMKKIRTRKKNPEKDDDIEWKLEFCWMLTIRSFSTLEKEGIYLERRSVIQRNVTAGEGLTGG